MQYIMGGGGWECHISDTIFVKRTGWITPDLYSWVVQNYLIHYNISVPLFILCIFHPLTSLSVCACPVCKGPFNSEFYFLRCKSWLRVAKTVFGLPWSPLFRRYSASLKKLCNNWWQGWESFFLLFRLIYATYILMH